MSFSPESLKEIAQLYGLQLVHEVEFQTAMAQGGDLLVQAAQAKTWTAFMNPNGDLASTIHPVQDSPNEIRIMVDSPYGHRREFSFKGPDSLGRMFPNDPEEPYLRPALADNEQAVLQLLDSATESIFTRIAKG